MILPGVRILLQSSPTVLLFLALAALIPDDEISEDNIIVPALDKRVVQAVAEAVIKTAKETDTASDSALQRDIEALIAQNGDCIGWLCIEETMVNYPVMHTPDNPEKYLRKSFAKKYSSAGVPFLDGRCDIDNTNLIIYGHNMKNGTMFADLKKYLDSEYFDQHRVITIETLSGQKSFQITQVVKTDTSDKRYNELEITGDKQRLILSTCYGSSKTDRLIVIAEAM